MSGFRLPLLFAAAALAVSPFAWAQETPGMLDDATAEFCLDAEANEIYSVGADGARQPLPLLENFAGMDAAEVFNAGIEEAIDKADAIPTSFVANVWETVIELIYGHDAFGQKIERVRGGWSENAEGHRCQIIRSPGFSSMYNAFREAD